MQMISFVMEEMDAVRVARVPPTACVYVLEYCQRFLWGSVPHIKLFLIHEKLILNLHCATSWQLWNIPIGHLEIAPWQLPQGINSSCLRDCLDIHLSNYFV